MGLMRVVATDVDTGDTREWTLEEGNYVLVGNDPCRLAERRADGTTHILTVKDVAPGKAAGDPVRIG